VALKAEAKAIINGLNLIRVCDEHHYPVYADSKRENWLIISGVGQTKVGEATKYLSDVSDAQRWTIWVNIGIAGSKNGKYGELFIVDKVTQDRSKNCFYPGTVVKTKLKKSNLLTVDKPVLNYREVNLVDMEAAAFVMVASKMSCRELILVMKVVSDGPNDSIKNLTAQRVSELISLNFKSIFEHIKKMTALAELEKIRFYTPKIYFDILRRWHFSVSQAYDLKKLIIRWEVATPSIDVMDMIGKFSSSREVIGYLKDNLNNYEIDWNKL